jgi:hypothetical protein
MDTSWQLIAARDSYRSNPNASQSSTGNRLFLRARAKIAVAEKHHTRANTADRVQSEGETIYVARAIR